MWYRVQLEPVIVAEVFADNPLEAIKNARQRLLAGCAEGELQLLSEYCSHVRAFNIEVKSHEE